MDPVNLFVSHSSKYRDIAASFKRSLLSVKSSAQLNIKLSEEMPAGKQWRQWIDDNVRTADVFVLLYPHPRMDTAWCTYELGRFDKSDDNVVCIRNTNIPDPPPQFEPYQSVLADEPGLMSFLKDLFVTGALTKGRVLNEDVDRVTSEDGALASTIACELAEQFTAAKFDERLYERSVVISVTYASGDKLDPDNSIIEGNESGLTLLGFQYTSGMRWSDLRKELSPRDEWPLQLEKAMPSMATGRLPPPLTPFKVASEVFIPVIVRADVVDRVLRQVFLIFVPADSNHLLPLFEGSSLPLAMPESFRSLIHFLRLVFRARWDVLEPRWTVAKQKNPSKDQCAKIASDVLSDYDELARELEALNLTGRDAFYDLFGSDLKRTSMVALTNGQRLLTN